MIVKAGQLERAGQVRVTTYQGSAFVGASAAAAFMGVSERHFLASVGSGMLPPGRKLGGRRIWRIDDLLAAADKLPEATP